LKIVIVGNAVPNTLELPITPPSSRAFQKDQSKGMAIWTAANLAHSKTCFYKYSGLNVVLYGVDDYGDAEYAKLISKALCSDPSVLAVIGSTASSTSRALGSYLSSFGIPLLMPIATSPSALLHPDTNTRMNTVLRLPPSDDQVQAPAVAYFAKKILCCKRTCIICDIDPGAETYSRPLCDCISWLLSDISIKELELSSKSTADPIARSILANKPDVIILCGYVSCAEQLLFSLNSIYPPDSSHLPKIILTDGAIDSNLDAGIFDVYLTFPLPPVNNVMNDLQDLELYSLLTHSKAQSYEIYAYDAILMINSSINECDRVSRKCLLKQLKSLQRFAGAAFTYRFIDGENADANYYVYKWVTNESNKSTLCFYQEVYKNQIDSIY
jgi:ABC-type branched-subunit amino acid transport system substrate-binding protein